VREIFSEVRQAALYFSITQRQAPKKLLTLKQVRQRFDLQGKSEVVQFLLSLAGFSLHHQLLSWLCAWPLRSFALPLFLESLERFYTLEKFLGWFGHEN
jgi:hypothetical protein